MHRLAPLVLLALVPACLWRSYGDVMRVHLEVLESLADKAAGNVAVGQRPTNNDVTELTYPLQRARQFAYQYRDDAARASYRRFLEALDLYQAMVDAIDAARGDDARWATEREALPGQAAAWRAAAAQTRDALIAEGYVAARR